MPGISGARGPERVCALVLLAAACGSQHDLIIGRAVEGSAGSSAGAAASADMAGAFSQAGAVAGGGGAQAGAAGTTGGGAGGAGAGSALGFALWRRDDFLSLDASVWQLAEHTFDENLADFSAANASVRDGMLVLGITGKPSGSAGKAYAAAEVRTLRTFIYGRFAVRARFASVPGVVSTAFTFHDFFAANTEPAWNEIVLETKMGAEPRLRFLASYPDAAAEEQRGVTEVFGEAGFDPSLEFHVYAFEWLPGSVRFLIDGQEVYALAPEIADALNLPQRFVMSSYPAAMDWVERFSESSIPVMAEYDWVEIYEYR